MIDIDGSAGEGGGQVLRSALALSLVTGRAFRLTNIRAHRKNPGMMRQHLTAVRAAAEIGGAETEGAAIGSGTLVFAPRRISPGTYHFAIGSAGSCTLVLQTVLPALLRAEGSSRLVIEGGTHNPMAPPFDFLTYTFLPLLRRMGVSIEAHLDRPGYYPAGGGRIRATIYPTATLLPLELCSFTIPCFTCIALCARLPEQIGHRELAVVHRELGVNKDALHLVQSDRDGPGNTLTLLADCGELTETFTGFGQRHVSAEEVALGVVRQAKEYLVAAAPVGPYLADQLLLPLALAGSGRFRTGRPSSHTLTNMAVIK